MIIHQGDICYPFSMQEIVYDRFWLSPFYALRITTVFLTYPSELWPSSALGINCRLNFERHFATVCRVVRSGKATFSLVRDRVLETLRLTASELKSDVSSHSTNPAYPTYIMNYIILYCICQEVFEIFMAGVWFLWVETNASKTKNRYKLAYPSCLLKKDVEVNSLSLLSEHWFAFSKRPHCFPTFKQCQQTTTGGARCQNWTALLVPKTRVLPLHFILHINGTIVVPTAYFSRYKPSGLCYASR